jgi:hypothetical protein
MAAPTLLQKLLTFQTLLALLLILPLVVLAVLHPVLLRLQIHQQMQLLMYGFLVMVVLLRQK